MTNLKSQLQFTRGNLLKEIEGISPEIFDVQPKGFNNNIHWHIGHILTVTEQFLLGYPQTNNLPANYKELFGNSTRPADWNADVPSIDILTQQLQEQIKRIHELPEERFSEKLPQPFLGRETVGELASLNVYHETYHLGQIHALKLILNAAK